MNKRHDDLQPHLETIKFSCWGEFRPTQNWRVISEDRRGSIHLKMSIFLVKTKQTILQIMQKIIKNKINIPSNPISPS